MVEHGKDDGRFGVRPLLESEQFDKEYCFISSSTSLSREGDSFLEDDVILEAPSDEGDYTDKDFRKNISSKVNSFLRHKFDQIILLIGAGGSVVPDDNGNPDPEYGLPMSAILNAIEEKLGDTESGRKDLFSLDEMKKFAFPNVVNVPDNLETLLSQFEKAQEFIPERQQIKYNTSLQRMRDIIREKTDYSYNIQSMKHLTLINYFNKRVSEGNKLSVVTTNYDTLIEEAAALGKYTVFDGFTFTSVPQFDAKMFDWNLVKDVPNLDTKELVYDRNVINLLKIHGSLTWERKNPVTRGAKRYIDDPLMIFPSSSKYEQSYHAPYSDLFYKFRELLNRPNTLLFTTGFSFGDFHIFEMVNDAIRHNDGLSVLFTDRSIGSKEPSKADSNLDKLKRRMVDGYRVAFLKATLNGDLFDYLIPIGQES